MTLQAVIEGVQDIIGAVSGIKHAPDYAPENIAPAHFPFVVAYPRDGSYTRGDVRHGYKGYHNIVVEVHVARKDLPRDMARVMAYVDSIPAALYSDNTLGGTCFSFEKISYRFLPMQYGDGEVGVKTVGFRFLIENILLLS